MIFLSKEQFMSLPSGSQNQFTLRSGLILYPPQQTAIESMLVDLLQQLPASFVLLADATGQVISARGETGQKNLVALGSLVAGDLAASHEIARLTGQYQRNQMVLREGESTHTIICEAGDYLALLVQISVDSPLGWARVVLRKAAQALAELAADSRKHGQTDNAVAAATSAFAEDENLGDLFSNALDELWGQ
jgi:predicted regulator of Ras-like GTPase activity (Roadblock/LC7/MglB family)